MEERIVDIELYNLLEENETVAYIENREAKLATLVYVWELEKFAKILDYNYFKEDGVDITWMGDYVAIEFDDMITDYFEHNLEAYRGAIEASTWNRYLELKEMED